MLVPSFFSSSGDDVRLDRVLDVIYEDLLAPCFYIIYVEIFTHIKSSISSGDFHANFVQE